MKNDKRYSDAELLLISKVGCEDQIQAFGDSCPELYRHMALKCFRENRNDNVSNAVRAAYSALHTCKLYRLSKEFDDLILNNLKEI